MPVAGPAKLLVITPEKRTDPLDASVAAIWKVGAVGAKNSADVCELGKKETEANTRDAASNTEIAAAIATVAVLEVFIDNPWEGCLDTPTFFQTSIG